MSRTTRRARGTARRLTTHVFLIAFGLLMIYPLLWMVSSSFKPNEYIFSQPGLWPVEFTLDNYVDGWTGLNGNFATFFLNSFVVAGLSIVGNLFACSLAAYAFARLRFRFKPMWFAIMLATIMLPAHVVLIPQYILFSNLGWVNTFLPLVIPKFLATDAFFIFLLVQFIRGLPRELDDAAKIDGNGFFGIFWRVILPLTTPALATTAIFTFIWTWNDFLTPLIYLTDPDSYTVPLALRAFQDAESESAWGSLFAMSTLSLIPIFGFFLVAQKYLVRGVATTGLK
ncbi:carbohydrate ABC transporter permease [Microbacterium sp. ET2]|uniref:carbohydrate ABC transporter permease n=1 Tax=Microbacterium albipurpureum TaxID=3050384 RepID=UPI00259CCFA0|nr:carbohydrate ABC transporter permease [Microbacterium sp. ET2 (Ac-2212)]WJL96966.1 carbohydrate ABC transporter permease [Microbacterium sp. ET2 (Ac-2212)]